MPHPFNYTIKTHTRAKHLKLKITTQQEVVVTKPKFIPNSKVDSFLKQHTDWILTTIAKITPPIKPHQIYIKGKLYTINYTKGRKYLKISHPHVQLRSHTKQAGIKTLQNLLKTHAKKEIKNLTSKWSTNMELPYNQIRFKDQSTRWGSCSSKQNLNFNWRLIKAPTKVMQYVIIHELAHLEHMDHSTRFWSLVETYDPDYREHRRWLKRNQQALSLDPKI